MDFVSLAGFLMTICHLALQIRGEEGELKFYFSFFTHPDTLKYAVKFSLTDLMTTCLTKLRKGELRCSQPYSIEKQQPCVSLLQSRIQSHRIVNRVIMCVQTLLFTATCLLFSAQLIIHHGK